MRTRSSFVRDSTLGLLDTLGLQFQAAVSVVVCAPLSALNSMEGNWPRRSLWRLQ